MTHGNSVPSKSVLTVTANPAVDVTYVVGGVELGSSHRVQTPMYRAGGKGINVSRVAHQQGCPTVAIAPVGGVSGQTLREDLNRSGIDTRLVEVAAATRSTIALVDTLNNQTSIFNEFGPALTEAEWQKLRDAVVLELSIGAGDGSSKADAGTSPGVLVGSGSLPQQAPQDFYPNLVELAHAHSVPAIIDTSGEGILAAAQAGADLLKPNNHELIEALGEHDLVVAARKLLDMGAKRILVSVGEEGMLAFEQGSSEYLQAKLPAPLRGNPTGAGDAGVSAAAVAIASGQNDLLTILKLATSWSAAAVLMPEAGEISPRHSDLAQQLIIKTHA